MWYENFFRVQVSEAAAMERDYTFTLHTKEGYSVEVNYQAKVYDSGSEYGINGGRISKLHAFVFIGDHLEKHTVLSYDRGWDVEPTGEIAEKALAFLLEKYKEVV